MKQTFRVQPFINKRNNQISLAVLKRMTSDKSLDFINDDNIKSYEINITKVFKKVNKEGINIIDKNKKGVKTW